MYSCSRCVLVFWKCMKVCYISKCLCIAHTQVCVHVITRVYKCIHAFAHTQVYVPRWGGKGTCLPTSVYECKQQQPKWRWGVLKWRSWCTVIRFQWGHRRIRRGPGKVLTWLRAARACSTCHLVSSDLSEVAPFGFIDDRRVRMLVLKH